jgi:ABC-2 type transport system ATP-binding protein
MHDFGQETVEGFLERLGSDAPTPGGGTGAAVTGAMGAALVRMLALLTVGRPKYREHEALMQAIAEQAGEEQRTLLALATEDATVYDRVSAAYRMPKETDEQRSARSKAIQEALRGAIDVPLRVMERCAEVISLAKNAVPRGNRNAVSDGAAGAELARSALKVASYNVKINLAAVEDATYAKFTRTRVDEMTYMAMAAVQEIDSFVQDLWKWRSVAEGILEIRGLEKRYGAVRAVDGIDLTVHRGTIYGFLGPNGAGKTTTIRIVAGLVRPTAGRVRLQGADVARDRLAASRGLRTLVEVPAFYPNLSGRANLGIHARLCRAPEGDVDRLLDAVALTEAADRAVGGYSLGMRQRLGVAQALLGSPVVVVLDEPMNGLDPAGMREMRNLIRRERDERGVTFFLSSHLLHDVELLCDEVGIIHRGKMVAEGPLSSLLSSAISGFRLETSDNAKAFESLRTNLPGAQPGRDTDGVLHVAGDENLLPALHRVLLAAGTPALAVTPVRGTLERYFLEKTEGVIG